MFTAGPMAEATYGAAVNGLSDAEVLALRRAAACAYSPRARGRSLVTLMLLNGAPTWKGEVEVVLQYARQVWAATLLGGEAPRSSELTLPMISQAWKRVVDGGIVPATGRGAWARVRGPVGALHLTLARIGWRATGPFTCCDAHDVEITLTRTPPALLAQLLKRAVIRDLECRVGAARAAHDPSYNGRRAAVDHVVAQLSRDRGMTIADRAAYRSVACGAIMTFLWAARLGYLVQDKCP